jgi:hypothetical protein
MGIPRNGFSRAMKKFYDFCDGLNVNGESIIGTKASVTGLTVSEEGFGHFRTLRFTMVNMPVSVVSVTTGNGVGGTKLYDLPAGRILFLGAMGEVSISVATAKQADFTDATPEGDIGLGTLAPANADALGTDATDDDLCTAVTFTMSSYAHASRNLISEATQQMDGTGTPKDIFLNVLVDAADIDDDVTTEVLINGTILFHYINLGDVT